MLELKGQPGVVMSSFLGPGGHQARPAAAGLGHFQALCIA